MSAPSGRHVSLRQNGSARRRDAALGHGAIDIGVRDEQAVHTHHRLGSVTCIARPCLKLRRHDVATRWKREVRDLREVTQGEKLVRRLRSREHVADRGADERADGRVPGDRGVAAAQARIADDAQLRVALVISATMDTLSPGANCWPSTGERM